MSRVACGFVSCTAELPSSVKPELEAIALDHASTILRVLDMSREGLTFRNGPALQTFIHDIATRFADKVDISSCDAIISEVNDCYDCLRARALVGAKATLKRAVKTDILKTPCGSETYNDPHNPSATYEEVRTHGSTVVPFGSEPCGCDAKAGYRASDAEHAGSLHPTHH